MAVAYKGDEGEGMRVIFSALVSSLEKSTIKQMNNLTLFLRGEQGLGSERYTGDFQAGGIQRKPLFSFVY